MITTEHDCSCKVLKIFSYYRKTPKGSDTQKFALITLKFEQGCFTME